MFIQDSVSFIVIPQYAQTCSGLKCSFFRPTGSHKTHIAKKQTYLEHDDIILYLNQNEIEQGK